MSIDASHFHKPESLYEAGSIDLLFPGLAPKVLLPWKMAGGHKGGRKFDREAVHGELAEPRPALALLDPRYLFASQPWVTRAGVAYYLTSAWHRTGVTFADRHSHANQLPLVERRTDGRDVLLGGHHRAAAALLRGQPLLARCVMLAGRSDETQRAAYWTPGLFASQIDFAQSCTDAGDAAQMILDGERVWVDSDEQAEAVMMLLESAEPHVRSSEKGPERNA